MNPPDDEERLLRSVALQNAATIHLARQRAEEEVARATEALERKTRELAASEAQFRQLADALPQIVWTARPDGFVDYFNERWYEFSGLERNQFGDAGWVPILHPEDVDRTLATYYGSIRSGDPYQIENRFRDRQSGDYRWFLGLAYPIRDDAGRIQRWFGTCTDVDDTKRIALENARLLAALTETDRRKDEFLALLAHELRNPLAPIRNAVQVIRLKGEPNHEVGLAQGVIDRQVNHLTRLVDDLLDVARITTGKIELRTEVVELATVVDSAVEASRPGIDKLRHELTVRLPDVPVVLEGDVTRLAQVLLNLLNNAAKYTDPGGRIALEAEVDGAMVAIRVRDDGVGIPASMLPKVFEMFIQLDSTLERTQGGLGIGLTLVHRLVELHGGSVEARSEGVGKGSEFLVRLPILAAGGDPGEREQQRPSLPHPALSALRILLVDDNQDAADTLGVLLSTLGHSVTTASDGLQGVGAATAFHPDVVIMDIGLPKLNGYDAARLIRAERGSGVVLIAVTGWGQNEDRRRSVEAGFDHHLTKPVDFPLLSRLLAEIGRRDR